MPASDWWFDECSTMPGANPVYPWERVNCTFNLPKISDFSDYTQIRDSWNLWEKRHENPYSGVILWFHPIYGETLNSWAGNSIPDLTDEQFAKIKAIDSIESLIFQTSNLENLLKAQICAKVYIDGSLEYSWLFNSVNEMFTEFDGINWTPNGCEYYDIAAINRIKCECGVEFYAVYASS